MRLNDILEMVGGYAPDADLDIVMRAYVFAAKSHSGQVRKSGEPYLIHPLEVAGILAQLRMDVDTIATALLHDTVEDTLVTSEDLSTLFSPEIARMVDGVTKIGKLKFQSKEEAHAENFRKMVLAMSKDIRVILVKLADRLHNMRTLEHMKPEKQREIAEETAEIYAPIANRLGLGRIKEELQDLCLRYLHPEAWEAIFEALSRKKGEREAYIGRTVEPLKARLVERGVECEVSGRAKSLFSIWNKMQSQQLEFEQIHDLLAFRVLVKDVTLCYAALGHIHGLYTPVPDKIKDYIAMPKANGYQSLHTTVFGPEGQRIEVQIRTHDMHRVAEQGIASHWRYKEGHLALEQEDIHRIAQLRELFETAKEVEDPAEFIQTVKTDLFTHEVYVFTPAREVKVMSSGATALDFAYAVHTQVGHHCIGAKVNGRMVPIRYTLVSGDTVEILTRPDQKPSRDWLRIARTGRALNKIRRALREQEEERGTEIGREMIQGELHKHGRNLQKLVKEGRVKAVAREHGCKDAEPLFVAVARGQVPLGKVVRDLAPDVDWDRNREDEDEGGLQSLLKRFRKKNESAVLISGKDDVYVTYARCCNPLPGEEVLGYITVGRGITVHAAGCPQLLAKGPERRIPVQWDPSVKGFHSSQLRIICANRPGMLAALTRHMEESGININHVEAHPIEDEKSEVRFEVQVATVQDLTRLMRNLEKVKGVVTVLRVRQ